MKEVDWFKLYHGTPLRARRRKRHLRKYLRYGLPEGMEGAVILDLCCGAGEFTSIAGVKNPSSLVLGMDMHEESFLPSNAKNLLFMKGDAARVPVQSGSCDHVFCFHSFHHLGAREEWAMVLAEAARIAKPGGAFHVIDHHNGLLMRLALLFFRTPFPRLVPWMRDFQIQLADEREILARWLKNAHYLPVDAADAGFACSVFRKSAFFFYARFSKPGPAEAPHGR